MKNGKKRIGFLIDEDLIESFGELAKKNKMNKTQLFIQICLKIQKNNFVEI